MTTREERLYDAIALTLRQMIVNTLAQGSDPRLITALTSINKWREDKMTDAFYGLIIEPTDGLKSELMINLPSHDLWDTHADIVDIVESQWYGHHWRMYIQRLG